MSDGTTYIIQPLSEQHHKADFCCGVAALDRYIQQQASQDVRRNIARVFVASAYVGLYASKDADLTPIIGYYTLSALSISLTDLPADQAKKLPKHPIPAALLGQLAVSQSAQAQGVGALLIADAIKRVVSIGDTLAVYVLVVDAIDESAAAYYQQFGFVPFLQQPRRLFLVLKNR